MGYTKLQGLIPQPLGSIGMIGAKVLLGAEGTHAGHLDQAIGAGHKPNLAWGHHATAHIYGSALGAHVLGAQNRLATQFAYVVLRRDVAAAAHIDQTIAVIEDGKRRGFAVHDIELAQRLRTHQKANAATAHSRNAALKIGDAAHIGKLIEHKLARDAANGRWGWHRHGAGQG